MVTRDILASFLLFFRISPSPAQFPQAAHYLIRTRLSPARVKTALQLALETHGSHVLLGPGVLGLPLAIPVVRSGGNGDLARAILLAGSAGECAVSARSGPDGLAEAVNLVENHLAHVADIVEDLEIEVEGGGAVRLVARVMPDMQVRVLECLLDADAAGGVEGEHAVQQV